jgi:hypothetical protein
MSMPLHDPVHARESYRGRRVQFRILDVRVPEAAEVLERLHGRDLLHGQVTDFTDSGSAAEPFAVVEVEELAQPVVVPTHCLNPAPLPCPPP